MSETTHEPVMADTNILVYCYDLRDPAKHQKAIQLVQKLMRSGQLVLSVQAINEFYVTVTHRKLERPLPAAEAVRIIREYLEACAIIPMTKSMTLAATDAVVAHGLSFWDALIWAAARQAGAKIIYSEDFQHGQEIEGVQFLNPFR